MANLTNAMVRKYLHNSILKWEGVVKGSFERGEDDCALCQNFDDCEGCPIMVYTGRAFCSNTPYNQWVTIAIQDSQFNLSHQNLPKGVEAAKDMLAFLKMLDAHFFGEGSNDRVNALLKERNV